MSLLKANAVQLGQSLTASQNFTWYQPASPDGTVRLGNGNSGSVTDLITVGSTGNLTFTGTTETYTNSVTISAASTRTLTLNGGGGSNGLVLSSANLVGVGTASPACPLDTNGMIRAISKAGAYPASGKGLEIYYESAADTAVLLSYDRGASAYKPLAYAALTHTFTISGTTAMVLDANSNFGIGGAAAGSRLTVQATSNYSDTYGLIQAYNTNVNSTDNASFTTKSYSGTGQFMQWQNYGMRIGSRITTNGGVGSLYFTVANDSVAMTLDASGNLLVGTPSVIALGLANFYSATNAKRCIETKINTTAASDHIAFFSSSGQAGQITVTGTTTAYGTGSDYRLKENIKPLQNALSRVALLKPSKYIWKADQSEGEGFIAHELQEVVPQAVTGEKDGEQMQGVDYGKLTPLLTAAIQELSAEIETLKQRIK